MQALDFLLPQPPFNLSPQTQADFEQLLASTPPGAFIKYQLNSPKWQFLSYICQERNLVLHGSQNTDIWIVEPRQAHDVRAFSDQHAIYATTDGIWVIFFSIIDRQRFPQLTLFNSCLDIRVAPGQVFGPLYFFSITYSVLLQQPWCDGTVYILPRDNFAQEASQSLQGVEIVFPHWVSSHPTRPVAKLRVQETDFPFMAQIHGHDNDKLLQLASINPDGFPWPEAIIS